ncbi:MAG: hypothetical protein QOH47_2417 [Sphingomonadales bacterium]|nr:hypothetical protein [Sphingomonadales bacterium]
MASRSSIFPAFITDEYRPGSGFAQFEQQAAASADRTRRQFETSFSEIQGIAQRALTMPRNAGGSLDLGVGQYRAAAQAADAQAIALREVATAAERAARATGDMSEQTRVLIQAYRAAAIQAADNAAAENQFATSMERVQAELNQTASRTTAVIGANRQLVNSQDAYSNSARASRFAMVQVGQQLQDVAIQAQMGTSALTILVQQGSQLGFAMSQMTGRAAAFGRFIAGPWGTAIFLGVAALGYLIQGLNRTSSAAEDAQHATDGLGEAQSALGEIFDMTTGKLRDQAGALREHIELMRLNARVTALNLQLQGMEQEENARRLFREGTEPTSIGENIGAYLSPLRGSTPGQRLESLERAAGEQRQLLQAIENAQQRLDAASGDAARRSAETALEAARNAALAASARPDFARSSAGLSAHDFRQAVIDQARGQANQRIAELTTRSLDEGRLDPSLRRTGHERRPREDHRPEQASSSIEQITRINEAWNDQPRLVDRAVQAVRELDQVLAEAQRRKLPRFDEMQRGAETARASIRDGLIRQITEGFGEAPKLVQRATLALEQLEAAAQQFPDLAPRIAAAGQTVTDALVRPYREFLADQVRSYAVGQLVAQGRQEEADALGIIHRLEEQLGPLGEERKQVILASVVALSEQARQLEIIRARQQLYLNFAGQVRSSLVDIAAAPAHALSSISGIAQAYRQLSAEALVERLFGNTFRQLEDQITGRDRVRQANEEMAGSIGTVRAEMANLGTAHRTEINTIDQVIDRLGRFGSAVDVAADRLSAVPSAAASGVGAAASRSLSGLPVQGRITNTFAQHLARNSAGLDIAAALGTAVTSRASGRVVTVGYDARSGYNVVIDHGGGIVSSYSHLIRQSSLRAGQTVTAGDVVGNVGETGHATGPHLHYRVRVAGRDVDPATFRFPEQAAQTTAAIERLGTGLHDLDAVIASLSDAAPRAGEALANVLSRASMDSAARAAAANDNGDIVVTAQRGTDPTERMSPRQFARIMATELATQVFGERFGATIGNLISGALEGASMYNAFFKPIQTKLEGLLGLRQNPLSAFGVAGTALGSLFFSPPRASSTIGAGAGGNLAVTGSTGSRTVRGQTTTAADSVLSTVARIAELFGGSVNAAAGAVSIGMRDGKYRVDPTGRGITKTKKGAIDFGEDAEAAVRAAVLDLIKDGVIEGLRQGTQTLLRAAKDIDSGIEKALKFEGVFERLKARLDPVGAALDTLDKEFANLKRVFADAGASAEEYAQLEQLYALERADAITQAGQRMTSALKSLLDDLTVNNDAISLRERLAAAHAKYDPLATRVAAGDRTVDYDAFAEAARLVLELQRQISGSTNPYFQALDEVTRLTRDALAGQENLISIVTARPGPLGADTVTAGDTQTVTAIDRLGGVLVSELGGRLDALNDNVGALVRQGASAGGEPSHDYGAIVNF